MPTPVVTTTMKKFGYPDFLVADYTWWSVLLRPKQVTLGSLILAAKLDVDAFSALPSDAFAELASVTADIETTLRTFSEYEKINYLMLMMVDREPHFHVVPRYEGQREYNGVTIEDHGWAGPPALDKAAALSDDQLLNLTADLKNAWLQTTRAN